MHPGTLHSLRSVGGRKNCFSGSGNQWSDPIKDPDGSYAQRDGLSSRLRL